MSPARSLRFWFGRRLPIVLQAEAAECGLACLEMILGYHGHRIDLGTLRRRYSVSLKGTTLRTLMSIAASMGLAPRALRLELKDLPRLHLPCILHWGLNHFVVLERVKPKTIIIHDPARGRRTVPLHEVSREFTGVALEATPTNVFVKKYERNALRLGDLFHNLAGLGPSFTRILLLSLGIEAVVLLIPIASQIVIDEVIVNADQDLLLVVGVGLALALVIQAIIGIARGWVIMLAGTTLNFQWSTSLFDHLMRLPLDYFEKRHVGDIISRFGSLTVIQKSLTSDFVTGVLDVVMSLGILVMLFVYGGWLASVALVATALNVALRCMAYRPYREATDGSIAYEATQQTHFIETVRGMASVKLLSLGDRRRASWLNHFVDTLNARLRLQRLDIVFSQTNELLFGADRLILLILGAQMVMSDRMTLGMLVAFLAYKDQFAYRIGKSITTVFQLRMLNVQCDRLSDIVMTEPEERDGGQPSIAPHRHGGASNLQTVGLSLRYGDNEPWIFRDISFPIPAGLCVAITGPSGCGKTSLLKVLMGLLCPTEGSILVDGIDLYTIGAANYRDRIAGVMQDDGLFAGSIAENICSFDDRLDICWIEECCARAAILDDIRQMPMGFETLVGDMGSTLSGGQKQRVVLARALYRRPAILFLDEATSHLDETTEAAVARALRGLRITRVIVAHRPTTIAHADTIIELESLYSRRAPKISTVMVPTGA